MFNYKTMLVYESELVADVAELEIVAESGCESIKASVLWRRVESRTTVHSTMNSSNGNNNNNNKNNDNGTSKGDENTLVTTNQPKTDQSKTKAIASINKKPKIKRKKKHVMIECKTFVFKPSNNGVINFGYKGLFDEKVMKEADRVYQEKKSKEEKTKVGVDSDNSADSKNADVDDDESDQRKRKEPKKPKFKGMNKIVVESKELEPFAIKKHQEEHKARLEHQAKLEKQAKELKEKRCNEQQENQDEELKEKLEQQEKEQQAKLEKKPKEQQSADQTDEQIATRPISIPHRRRSGAPAPTLPTIKEETEAELEAAEQERWFFEEFCCGILPPPEELDDWSEPAIPAVPEHAPEPIPISPSSGLTLQEEKAMRQKLAEAKKLGIKKFLDATGKTVVTMTPEAKAQLLQSKEFRDYVKRINEMKKMTGTDAVDGTMKVEIVPFKSAIQSNSKQSSALASGSASVNTNVKAPSSVTPPDTPKMETFAHLSSAVVLETPMKSKRAAYEKAQEEMKREMEQEELRMEREREEMRREKDIVSEDDGAKPGTSRKQPKVDLSSFKRRRI